MAQRLPMSEWNVKSLAELEGQLKINVKMIQLTNMLVRHAGGFMDEAEAKSVRDKIEESQQVGQVIELLRGKGDEEFVTFCEMLRRSNYEGWANKLQLTAERLKNATGPDVCVQPSYCIPDIKADYVRVKTMFVEVCAKQGSPSLEEVRDFCIDLIEGVFIDMPPNRRHQYDIMNSNSMTELARVVCFRLSKWVSYDFLKEVIAHFQPTLESVKDRLMRYENQLKPLLELRLRQVAELQQREVVPVSMAELAVKYKFNSDLLLVNDMVMARDFLAKRLGIPDHLLQVLSWGDGSIIITYWIPRAVLPAAELALCREEALVQLNEHGADAVYLDSHPLEHPGPVDQSLQIMHLKRRAIVTALDAYQWGLDDKSLTTDLESVGILTTEQCQKLVSLVDSKKQHEALLYALIAQGKPDTFDKLVESAYMMSRGPSLAAALQATFENLKKYPSSLAIIGSSQSTTCTSVAMTIRNAEEVSGSQTAQELSLLSSSPPTTPSLPPLKCHYRLGGYISTIFSSTGGFQYSPVYGAKVYIPAGAILGKEQVEVSFRLVKEEVEIQEFRSQSLPEGSVLCSHVFEFIARWVNAPDGEEFGEFHSDVWIELPHCWLFGGGSLKDYSTACVVSERRGKVEVEEQAVFSEGHAYIEFPVRHFSKFCVILPPKRRFAAAAHVRKAMPKFCVIHIPKKRLPTTVNVRKAMQKLCISNRFDKKHSASPNVRSRLMKQELQEAASPSTASTAADKRALYYEMRKASSEASAEEEHSQNLMLVRQYASDIHYDEDAMEVDPAALVYTTFDAPLQLEPFNAASMSVMARVYQPKKRHKMHHWTADIVFAPHLHSSYKTLANVQEQFECCTAVFHLELRTLLIRLRSGPSPQGWSVELDRTAILLKEIEVVALLLSSESGYSSKMADFLPKCTATVQNHETFLPLRHPIEVERSDPPTHLYLTCEPVLDEVGANDKTLHCSQGHAQHDPKSNPSDSTQGTSRADSVQDPSPSHSTQDPSASHSMQDLSPSGSTQSPSPSRSTPGPSPSGSTLIVSTPSSFPFVPFPPQQRGTIQWERDLYVLALLAIMIPEDHLAALGESLGLPHLTIDHVLSGYTARSALSVGERAYEMFRRAHKSEQPLTFGKIFVTLSEISNAVDLVPILRSYLQSLNMVTSGTPLEGDDSIPNHFLAWLRVNHPTLIPLFGIEEKRTISPGHSEQDSLFLYLSPKLVCVWRMVGRLLGLTDLDIEAIDAAYNSRWDKESEPCYQMLLKWVQCSRRPSDITYYRLMAALQLTSRGVGAANDAIFYLRNFVLNLTSARN